MTPLERMARAVAEARALPGTKPARVSDVDRRAAVAVLRELLTVDDAMLEAGHKAMWDAFEVNAKPEEISCGFTAMIRSVMGDGA